MMQRRVSLLSAGAFSLTLLVYVYIGTFSRWMADDYCFPVTARTLGFPALISYYYDSWIGRITQIVGVTIGTLLGVRFAQVFPAILLLTWLLGLLWLARELSLLLRIETSGVVVAGAALILYATLAGTPQIFHSLYWVTAVFPYTVPLVLVTYNVALAVRTLRTGAAPPLVVAASAFLILVAGMTSEPFALVSAGANAGGVVAVLAFRQRPAARRALLTLLIASTIAACVALASIVVAPGNQLRQSLFTPTRDAAALVSASLIDTIAVIVVLVQMSPPAIGLALLLPAIWAYWQPVTGANRQTLHRLIALVALIALGLITLTNVPGVYATSSAPPARALIIPQYVLVCASAAIGWLGGLSAHKANRHLSPRLPGLLLAVLLVSGPLLTAAQLVSLVPKLSIYAEEWDARDAQISAAAQAGQQAIVVAPLSIDVATLTGLDRIGSDATAFTNVCAAGYYGVASLTASS